ncbi:MAG: MAE_28990/MAE_18760 family HEPN-like nuclease [Paludibacteraceae bacterium]|nr:MAE_28990/MAE_18760 family HEPN-like nuclease [Paludibacteraceae bacterium]
MTFHSFEIEFQNRCKDVDNFFDLLTFIDNIAYQKKIEIKGESFDGVEMKHCITNDEQKILRSTAYLVLYNLIESTINLVVNSIVDSINDEQIELEKLKDNYKKKYLESIFGNKNTIGKLTVLGMELLDTIFQHKNIEFENLKFGISGNLDYKKTLHILNNLGCVGKYCNNTTDLKLAMKRIKDYRNRLAHGEASFVDCGSNIVISDIKSDYTIIHEFLDNVMSLLTNFIDNKEYLK